uniref:pyroglutamyl-peptidase 1 isoform X2 n=1 Tax=Ictidomys tridecemlineatus TaxID=43179 RepID=UPI001A9E79A2|nr:pyroglutamyl-peptidase 1 isoform X2 [Ictidomys tridecemlineatus]
MEQPRKAVVVTGFGPFGEHTVNASWIAVQELEKLGLGDSVDLHVYEIPVEYKTVQRLIPALWEKHSPQLVVHVGVSGMATTVTLEKCGHNKGYKGLDNCRFCPGSQCCVEDGPESIDSIIDMDAVCKRVTTLGLDVTVTISQDAGRATAARPSSTCPRWASPTTPTSWAGRCGPSSRRCWTCWSSQKTSSATATNTERRRPPKTSPRGPKRDIALRGLARKTSGRPRSPGSSLSAEAPVDLKQRLGLLLFPCALGDTAATARRSTSGPRRPGNPGQVARAL